ncbi:MAG: hypothetical protein C0598_02255 [Marinilabiliales bacterium]|nr:MAG: hypothetical protein C0598_02255 [Marinilabiliales bacterium]
MILKNIYSSSVVKLILLISITIVFSSCCENQKKINIDYSENSNWLIQDTLAEKSADVFFVYPTIYGDPTNMIMDIKDSALREKAFYAFKKQASVFHDDCNSFAPYYRQVSMVVLSKDKVTQDSLLSIGFDDVKTAFYYYLENLNNGRPFILAGHSQGSEMLLKLITDKKFNEEVYKNMIAAYLIGYSVTNEDLEKNPLLKMAMDSTDTGVIISYNTQSPDAKGSPVLLKGAHCINPLSWSINEEIAIKEKNLGAVLFNDYGEIDSIIPMFTSAQIDLKTGALIAADPNPKDYDVIATFPLGVYHVFDYSFFYNNLKKNVHDRIEAFKSQ